MQQCGLAISLYRIGFAKHAIKTILSKLREKKAEFQMFIFIYTCY
tara:strand:- start:1203 stop:1337 length:135 start_codon:yes stop_codon:yes gene_type:complete